MYDSPSELIQTIQNVASNRKYASSADVPKWSTRPRLVLLFEVFCQMMTNRNINQHLYGEQKIAQFRPHDLTKELAYVSTQIQAKFDTCI